METRPARFITLKRLSHHCFIVLLATLCYSAPVYAYQAPAAHPATIEKPVGRLVVQLTGIADVADAIAFRDLLQGSSLVEDLKPERLTWAAGRPDLGLAQWSLRVKDDARGALEAELLTRSAAREKSPLRLTVRNSSRILIEFAIAVAPVSGSGGESGQDEAASVDDELAASAYSEAEDVVFAPNIRSAAPIRGGRGFD